MNTTHHPFRMRELATTLVLVSATGVMTGCGSNGSPEPGPEAASSPAQVQQTPGAEPSADVTYTGPYDEEFRSDLAAFTGQQVTLIGEVSDLAPSRSAVVLTSPEEPDVDPLLVTARYGFPEAEEGAVVEVTGTVQADFRTPADRDDADAEAGFYDRHTGRPYVDQAELSTANPAGT